MFVWSVTGMTDAEARRRAFVQSSPAGAPTGTLRQSGSGGGGAAVMLLFWVAVGIFGLSKLFVGESPQRGRETEPEWIRSLDAKRQDVEDLLAPEVQSPEVVDLVLYSCSLDTSLVRRVEEFGPDPGLRRLVSAFDEKRLGLRGNRSFREILSSGESSSGFVAVFEGRAELAAHNQSRAEHAALEQSRVGYSSS